MKIRTFHNRIDRHEFTFSRADVIAALKAEIQRMGFGKRPATPATEAWDLDVEYDDEAVSDTLRLTMTQRFEYLSPAEPQSADAVGQGSERAHEEL